jgi:UDP-N-acetyl-D-galactosamine dehydrogenase
MGIFVANKLVKLLSNDGHSIKGLEVLVLGITFKENCPDTRNTRVIDVVNELKGFGLHVDVYDYFADANQVKEEYDIKLIPEITEKYKAIVLAVAHENFLKLNWNELALDNTIIFDLKGFLPKEIVSARL